MTLIDTETKRKLREMGVSGLVDALDSQDDVLTIGMPFAERLELAVDDAHATFAHQKIEGLIRRASLRYPDADLRRLDLIEERGLDRGVIRPGFSSGRFSCHRTGVRRDSCSV